jgi:hypothetical protein
MRTYSIAILVFLVPTFLWAARGVSEGEQTLTTLSELISGISQSEYVQSFAPGAMYQAKVVLTAHMTGLEKCLAEKQDPKVFRQCLLAVTSPVASKTWLESTPAPECR